MRRSLSSPSIPAMMAVTSSTTRRSSISAAIENKLLNPADIADFDFADDNIMLVLPPAHRHQTSSSPVPALPPPPPPPLLSDRFFAFITDEDFRRNLLSIDLYEDFGVFHRCLPRDDDPFVGLVRDNSRPLACCVMREFLDSAHDSFDEAGRSFRSVATAFGEQLQRLNALVYEIDIRILLHDHWKFKGNLLAKEPLYEFVANMIPRHVDDDGVEWHFSACSVCLAQCRYVRKPSCCRSAICQPCWTSYVNNYAKTSLALHINGVYDLHCFSCSKLVPYGQALVCTNPEDLQLIRPKVGRGSLARCPICLKQPSEAATTAKQQQKHHHQTDGHSEDLLESASKKKKSRRKKGGLPITCDRCGHVYCAFCGTTNHPKISCQQLTGSEMGLRKWTREKSAARPDFPNGRFCPVCHIPVSHSGGCPQMTCPCGAEFCYSCGRKYCKSLPYLLPGHKSSRYLPIISCPKLWKSQPTRIAVHSIIGLAIVVGIGPIALAISPIVVPAAVGYYMMVRSRRRRR